MKTNGADRRLGQVTRFLIVTGVIIVVGLSCSVSPNDARPYRTLFNRWFSQLKPRGFSVQSASTFADTGVFIFPAIGLLLIAGSVMLRRQAGAEIRALKAQIRELQQAEETLSRQREYLFMLLEAIPNPVYYRDARGNFIGCNRAFEVLTGFIREEIIGKAALDSALIGVADSLHQRDMELLDHPGRQTDEYPLTGKDGRMRRLVFNKATLIDTQGKITGIIGVIFDMAETTVI